MDITEYVLYSHKFEKGKGKTVVIEITLVGGDRREFPGDGNVLHFDLGYCYTAVQICQNSPSLICMMHALNLIK